LIAQPAGDITAHGVRWLRLPRERHDARIESAGDLHHVLAMTLKRIKGFQDIDVYAAAPVLFVMTACTVLVKERTHIANEIQVWWIRRKNTGGCSEDNYRR